MSDYTPDQEQLPLPASVRIRIDLAALAANYRQLCHRAGGAEVAGVVKANAYGLGLAPVATRLADEGCRTFFVTTVGEGVELRRLLPKTRIFVLDGLPADAEEIYRQQRLMPVLNTLAEARAWAQCAAGMPCALQFDTGMTRAGLPAREVASLGADTALRQALTVELILSHLACADDASSSMNAEQLEHLTQMRQAWPKLPWSLANSAGIFLGEAFHGQLVRPGIALYGGRPMASGENPMAEVVRVQARVLQIRELAAAAHVGYGASHLAAAKTRIATVGIGYADGYPRALSNRAEAAFNGTRCALIGRVSMDLITLDISGPQFDALAVGDFVDVIGGGIDIEEVAAWAGTIHYELLTQLSLRAERIYT